ncbi:SusC/RagA family TonB-linked outer membrane protein [Pontibacter sp. HSC-36F09]|uniref:SusC/RagA family TonB-linked outer membrane protein n=1 Tax=Pontibacter sp. HSC-36F09 TaxID=2910966 RepID=UPI00209E6FE6|nr:SusC/RagA family TonB-linked outer membrane protein [Pontibacter sp. HSC-36F09]MCP2042207.1 TonB-linked SusC/RagA family outer membrane protein [Pontibacter sp. HSC-36F09]
MNKLLLVSFILILALFQPGMAQTRAVTGTVTDQETGQGLPGVAVLVQGTSVGTATGANGEYSINVPAGSNTLAFRFIGYTTVTREVGNESTINVTLSVDTRQLQEVVVTAVGIERTERSLGYAVQNVEGDQLSQRSEPNVVNALQGKVAGVEIISSSGLPGAGTQVFIRGISSATGNNQPLFVVDGIPIDNSTNFTSAPTVGGAAYSNRGLDINPNDIESMTVLKGPAAAALYGSRAANGAIIITTKKGMAGDANKKFEVTVTSSFNLQNVYGLPEYQNDYGQGTNFRYSPNVTDSWGPRFGTPGITTVPNVAGNPQETLEYRAYPDNVEDFFETGTIFDNGLQLAGAGANTRYIFSANSTNQSGIIPNSGLDRFSLRAAGTAELSYGISLDASIIYANTEQEGSLQGNSGTSPWFTLPFTPRSFDVNNVPYKIGPGQQAPTLFTQLARDNPRWSVNENFYESEVNRTITSATVNWKPQFFQDLTFTYRIGLDQYSDKRREAIAFGSINSNGNTALNRRGSQIYDDIFYSQFNQDIFGVYTKDLNEDINLRFLVGNQINAIKTDNRNIRAEDLITPEFYNLINHTNTNIFPTNTETQRRLVGVYSQLGLSYRNWLFLELQGRNDWSSTLALDNNSYFYPAASVGFVFTDAFDIANPILSYGKLRGSYARVGNDAGIYLTNTVFVNQGFGNNVAGISFPFNGTVAAVSRGNRRGNLELNPEFTTSYEAGVELGMFDGRASLDVNYFFNKTTDQIFNVDVPGSTGFTTFTQNAGEIQNKGWEISATGTPFTFEGGFRWDVNVNFTDIQSKVVSLAPGLNQFTLLTGAGTGAFTGLSPVLIPGQPFGVIQSSAFLRDEQGRFIINPNTGVPVVDQNPQIIADPNADWWGSLGNTFSFKGFNLNVLLQYVHGGDFYSRQTQIARLRGVLEEQTDRERPYMFEGVVLNADGTSRPNTTQISAQEYWVALNAANEFAVFDASVFRVREVSLGYELPAEILERTPFGAASISVSGRNLFFYAPNLPHADPESNQLGGNTRGFEFNSPPTVRNYGVNLRFTF